MEIKKIFNIILLAISLTTVFITLISYIIFKLRQAGLNKKVGSKHLLETGFFRRYAPKLEKENEHEKVTEKVTPNHTKVKIVSLFVIIFGSIFTIFLFEDYFTYRKQIEKRETSAKEFRSLIKKGLLKNYEYDLTRKNKPITARNSVHIMEQINFYKSELSTLNICLMSSERAGKFNKNFHDQALKKWVGFLTKYEIPNKVIKHYSQIRDCLLVLPHISSLSKGEIKSLETHNSFIATGNLGSKNGLGADKPISFVESLFGIKLETTTKSYPSLIINGDETLWNIAGGLYLEWKPIDLSADHYLSSKDNSIIMTDFNATIDKLIIDNNNFLKSRLIKKKNQYWSSLDPQLAEGNLNSDLVFLTLLNEVNGGLTYSIGRYPDKENSINSLIVMKDSAQNNGVDFIEKLFKQKVNFSLFANSIYYRDYVSFMENKNNFEPGLLESNSDQLGDLKIKEVFYYLERSRLDIEEYSRKKLKGFSAFKENLTMSLTNTLDQNRMGYVFGGKKELSYSPIFLGDSELILFPRITANSRDLEHNNLLISDKDFLLYLKGEKENANLVGGLFMLVLSNSFLQNPILKKGIEGFLKLPNKYYSLGHISTWLQKRENLQTTLIKDNKSYILKVKNNNKTDLKDIAFKFKVGNFVKSIYIESISGMEERKFRLK